MNQNAYLHNPQLDGAPFMLEGTGKNAVLLLHGFTATCSEVRGLGRVLNRIGYTAAGVMLPGHGTRPEDLNRTRWQDWAEAVDSAYLDLAKHHQRVFVGGESTGGLLALYLAIRHPEIAGVLAYAPALKLPLRWYQPIQLRLFALFIASLPKGDLAGNTTWQGYTVNPLKALIQLIELQKQVRARLGQIRQPLLIVQGRGDKTIDPASAQIVYDQVGSQVKELHWLEESGHCVLLEKEQHKVNRLTMDFLFKVQSLS